MAYWERGRSARWTRTGLACSTPPPIAATTGIRTTVWLARHYSARIDSADHPVDHRVSGRLLEVAASLETHAGTCAGAVVAENRQ